MRLSGCARMTALLKIYPGCPVNSMLDNLEPSPSMPAFIIICLGVLLVLWFAGQPWWQERKRQTPKRAVVPASAG